MTLSNWLELGALLLVLITGMSLWLFFRRRLRQQDGFNGIIKERGKQPARRKMDLEEEIQGLESILDR